jgi:hypothetical protein
MIALATSVADGMTGGRGAAFSSGRWQRAQYAEAEGLSKPQCGQTMV